MHQRSPVVGQNDHALAVPYLLEQVFHHRAGVRQQIVVARQGVAQVAATGVLGIAQPAGGQQARSQAALPGTGKALVDGAGRAIAEFQQMQPCLAQGQGGRCCTHFVSSTGEVPFLSKYKKA